MARDTDGIIQIKWANSGDVGLGGLDVNEMWDITYSQPGGALPQRIQFNQFYRWLSALAVEINQNGPFLEYNATIDYSVGSWVTGSNGFQYYCRVANGPASSVVDPVGNPITWKLGSNNTSLVLGSDDLIDAGLNLQIADQAQAKMELSTGGSGGQGAARKSMRITNTDASASMAIDCYDFDTAAGVKLVLNGNNGEVGIGTTPNTGKFLHVEGDALFNDDVEIAGQALIGGDGSPIDVSLNLQIADETSSKIELSTAGSGGQGAARKSMRITNTDASASMAIDCYDFDATTGVKLTINGNGGEVGIGKVPDDGVELDVQGGIAASGNINGGSISTGGKNLVPDNTSFFTNLTSQTINTTPSTYNQEDLGTLSIGDTFMITVGVSGTRAAASELIVNITTSGTGTISGPHNQDGISNYMYSPNAAGFDYSFSALCNVTVAGTVQLDLAASTDVSSISAAAIGLRVQFFRKA